MKDIKMLFYKRIDVSDDSDISKTDAKECITCCYW